jgi:hypothetical protein
MLWAVWFRSQGQRLGWIHFTEYIDRYDPPLFYSILFYSILFYSSSRWFRILVTKPLGWFPRSIQQRERGRDVCAGNREGATGDREIRGLRRRPSGADVRRRHREQNLPGDHGPRTLLLISPFSFHFLDVNFSSFSALWFDFHHKLWYV